MNSSNMIIEGLKQFELHSWGSKVCRDYRCKTPILRPSQRQVVIDTTILTGAKIILAGLPLFLIFFQMPPYGCCPMLFVLSAGTASAWNSGSMVCAEWRAAAYAALASGV